MSSFDRMIKVRIAQPGMQTYTGYIRGTRFDNGVSVDPMPIRDALRLGAACAVQDMEGRVVSPNYMEFKDANTITGMDVTPPQSKTVVEQAVAAVEEPEVVEEEGDEIVDFYDPNEEHAEAKKWTLEALEAIADAEGISGLREIGEEFAVKERSIDGLIKEIMKAQDGAEKLAGEEE
jgi:hypothetical protein